MCCCPSLPKAPWGSHELHWSHVAGPDWTIRWNQFHLWLDLFWMTIVFFGHIPKKHINCNLQKNKYCIWGWMLSNAVTMAYQAPDWPTRSLCHVLCWQWIPIMHGTSTRVHLHELRPLLQGLTLRMERSVEGKLVPNLSQIKFPWFSMRPPPKNVI